MHTPVRILIVEDSPEDAQLMESHLEAAGMAVSVKRVQGREAFVRELMSSPPDAVLADYVMPGFDGLAALRELRKYHPHVPLIVVTGTLNDETAAECIKAGAEDYVLKHRMNRLAPALQAALAKRRAEEERERVERALRESELRYRRLFESAREGILLLEADTGRITDVNPFALEWTGASRDDVVGRTLLEAGFVADAGAYRALRDQLAAAGSARAEVAMPGREGRTLDIEMDCSVTEHDHKPVLQCNARDVTARRRSEEDRRKMQTQLFQAQKMEAIGAVAAGVAHDFNNLMTAVQISADLAMMKVGETHDAQRELKEIRNAALHASGLIRQLLLFSRKHPMEFRVFDLNPVVDNLLRMLHRLIGEDIEIQPELEAGLAPIRADAGNMEQVVMNLVLNARDAMPEGGRIVIRTANAELPDPALSLGESPGLKPGPYMVLTVSDTGTGMDRETLEHIFEPFFTTKAPGKGTGLGLSVVYGIVKQHGGAVQVQSHPGRGSTFRVFLPAASEDDVRPAESKPAGREITGEGQCILLVEDEEKVRESATKALARSGYRVLFAGGAVEALDILRSERGKVDLVFSDVVLADRTGIDLADDILREFPGMKILLSSGYTDQKSQWPIIRERGFLFLQKPYDLSALLRAVHNAMK